VEVDGELPLLLDLGTGLRNVPVTGAVRTTALVTHLHLDHVQGLPFFPPVHTPGTRLDVYGPAQGAGSLHDAMAGLIRPPYFPVPLDRFPAQLRFHDVLDDDFTLGRASVKVRPVPHIGPTVGYRVDCDGASVAYVSDHQAPVGHDRVAESVLELCDGVDLLIHDAQYTEEEFTVKSHWGHCTVDYAVLVARQAGARRLCLFHHDPAHDDDDVDRLLEHGRARAGHHVGEVIAAAEGLTVEL